MMTTAIDDAGRNAAGDGSAPIKGASSSLGWSAEPGAVAEAKPQTPAAFSGYRVPDRNRSDIGDLDRGDLLHRAGNHLLEDRPGTRVRREVGLEERLRRRGVEGSGRPCDAGGDYGDHCERDRDPDDATRQRPTLPDTLASARHPAIGGGDSHG